VDLQFLYKRDGGTVITDTKVVLYAKSGFTGTNFPVTTENYIYIGVNYIGVNYIGVKA